LRNIFDQYDQPENKLTHALACTLSHDRWLIRPFLRWLGIADVPPVRELRVVEQQVPGVPVASEEAESTGLPDACIYTPDGWAALIEAKVQAKPVADQLRRHRRTALRHGYDEPHLVLITVDLPKGKVPEGTRVVEWRDLYAWFGSRSARSQWAGRLVQYLEAFESKMAGQDYDFRGTLTMFDGLKFDAEHPYTWREAKRLIRLLGDELQKHKDLIRLGVDPEGKRRPAITGRGGDRVWDFLPLKVAHRAKNFTAYPHLTMNIFQDEAVAMVTVPNGVTGGFRSRLKEAGIEGFQTLVSRLEKNLRPVCRRSKGAKPMVYIIQRHYPSQRSAGVVDARLDADLRTIAGTGKSRVKYQPEWVDAIYAVLCNKQSNIQLGTNVHFRYDCPLIRSPKAVDLFAQAWIAMWPLVEFVLDH